MPSSEDLCTWCGNKYGKHSGGNLRCQRADIGEPGHDRFSDTYNFAAFDTITIDRVPIGSRIQLRMSGNLVQTTVAYRTGSHVIVGWKSGSQPRASSWSRNAVSHSIEQALCNMGLDYGWSIPGISTIHRVSQLASVAATATSAPAAAGLACALSDCRTFYPMAVPNQPDGRFICYSCRSTNRHLYMK